MNTSAEPAHPDLEANRANLRPGWQIGPYRYVRRRWHVLFGIVDTLGWLVRRAVHLCRAIAVDDPGSKRKNHSHRDPRSILIVQLDHLGDAVISTVLFPALRRRFPRASIDVLCGAWNRELFEAIEGVDQVFASRVNHFVRGGRGRWISSIFWWGWQLRRRRYDLGIDVRGEFPNALLLWLAGARRRLGWDCGGGGFLLTESPAFVRDRPELDSRLALLEVFGIDMESNGRALRPSFDPGTSARRRVAMDAFECESAADRTFVVHMGAGMPAKRWPVENWSRLVREMCESRNVRVVLVGDRNDADVGRRICQSLGNVGVTDATGRYGLCELAALIERADVFVGADSGPAHLAAAVGTPAVVLFSGTNRPEQWQPRGAPVAVVRHAVACAPCHQTICPIAGHPCLNRITPEAVLAAVNELCDDPNRHTVGRWLEADLRAGTDPRIVPIREYREELESAA